MNRTIYLFLLIVLVLPSAYISAADTDGPVNKTLVWPDGTRYVGGVLDGKRSGKGTIFWQDGTRFVGEFRNDLRNGPGTMILPDGTVYNGYFENDILVNKEDIAAIGAETGEPVAAITGEEAPASMSSRQQSPEATVTAGVSAPINTPASTGPAPVPVPEDSLPLYQPVTRMTPAVEEELRSTINLWAAAWSEKNVTQYLSNYADDFRVPDKQSRRKWESVRKSRLTRPKYIRIDITFEKFDIVDADVAEVQFVQRYNSNTYSDVTNKVLRLRKEQEHWKIIQEGNR
ncbi:MAG: hypothetical protein KDI36_13705 [Pseudomonadales bacterium]|nr:hypothetical protein [Pseudomonadales bacterium]